MSRVEKEFQDNPAQYMLNFWAGGIEALSPTLNNNFFSTPTEAVEHSAYYLEKAKNDPKQLERSVQMKDEIMHNQRAKERDMNNFWVFFLPSGVRRGIIQGLDIGTISFVFLPFAIDRVFNGAWSRMCQEKRKEIEIVVRGAAHLDKYDDFKDPAFDHEVFKNAICELALYLDQQGVPLTSLYA